MRIGLWLLLFSGVLAPQASGLPALLESCRKPLRQVGNALRLWKAPLPNPISEHPEKQIYPNALPLAGNLIRPNQSFPPELKDDHYIYLVVRHHGREYVMYSVRAPGGSPSEPDKNLATHMAMLKQASLQLDVPLSSLSVHAAGQFQILHGLAARVDNRSGTWRGDQANFEYGVDALKRCGLQLAEKEGHPKTKRDNYQLEGADVNFHAEADEIADQRRRIDADPALSRIRARIVELHAKLYRDFPELRDPHTPGYLDVDKVYSNFYLDPDREIDPVKRADLSMVKVAFNLRQVDGPHTAAIYFNNFDAMSEAKVMELLDLGYALHQKKHAGN